MTSGLLPASIALDAEQVSKAAAVQGFVDQRFDTLSAADVEEQVTRACATGDLVERAVLYRAVGRCNGHFGELSTEWLRQLAQGSR